MGKSPQVILKEKTLVTATTNSSDTAVAIIGYARNGEINKPVLCTNLKEFKDTFGGIPETAPWSSLAAYRAFNYCNKVYYVRVADESIAQKAKYVIRNSVAAKPASLTFNQDYSFPASVIKADQDYAFVIKITNGGIQEEKKIYFHSPDGGDLEVGELASKIVDAFKPFYNYQDSKEKTATFTTSGDFYIPVKIQTGDNEVSKYLYSVYITPNTTFEDIIVALNNAFNGDPIKSVIYSVNFDSTATVTENKVYYKFDVPYNWQPNQEFESNLVAWENDNVISPNQYTFYETKYYQYTGEEDLTIITGDVEPTTPPDTNTDFVDVTQNWDEAEINIPDDFDGQGAANTIASVINQQAASYTAKTIEGSFNLFFKDNVLTLTNGTNSSVAINIYGGEKNVVTNIYGSSITATELAQGAIVNLLEASVVNGKIRIAEKINGDDGNYIAPHTYHFLGVDTDNLGFTNNLLDFINFYDLVEGQYEYDGSSVSGVPCTTELFDSRVVIKTLDAKAEISLAADAFEPTEQFANFYALNIFTDCSYADQMTTAVEGADEISSQTRDNIYFTAKNYGTANAGSNGIVIEKSTTVDPLTNQDTIKINIYFNGDVVETYNNVSMDPNEIDPDKIYFVTAINNSPDNGGSKYIDVKVVKNETSSVYVDFPDGVYTLGKGTSAEADNPDDYDYNPGNDGIPTSNPRKSGISLFSKVLKSDSDLANTEVYNYHILATPDNGSQVVQDKAMQLCELTGESFYLVDPPQGLTYQEVVKYEDGEGNFGRNSALNSSYEGIFHDWLMDYDEDNENYVWCPPSVFILELLLKDDKQYGCWYAPAGDTRGVLTAADYASSPSLAQRDYMYGDLHTVNPIVNFASRGLELYGQKTCLRKTTDPMSRIHIRRMAIYIKKLLKETLRGFIFEPNNASSWTRATSMIAQILEPIKQDNGIAQYAVQIDNSTMTEADIANNIMKGKITIVPEGMIEIIEMNITFLNPGATITEV